MSRLTKFLASIITLLAVGLVIQTDRLLGLRQQVLAHEQSLANDQTSLRVLQAEQTQMMRTLADLQRAIADQANLVAPNAAHPGELQSWLNRVQLLKDWLQRNPNHEIPELRYLTPNDWLMVTMDRELDTDAKMRDALGKLRNIAKAKPAIIPNLAQALRAYAQVHPDRVASSPADIFPYLNPPLDAQILRRYEFITPGQGGPEISAIEKRMLGSGRIIMQETTPVDADYDSHAYLWETGAAMVNSVSALGDIVSTAEQAFAKTHSGQSPDNVEQLIPFLPAPVDEIALREFWDIRSH